MKKTKIICTLGPSSNTPEIIGKLLDNGMNVARINCSHGSYESHGQVLDMFRKVRDGKNMAAAVMLDTRGPEIRLGTFENYSIDF